MGQKAQRLKLRLRQKAGSGLRERNKGTAPPEKERGEKAEAEEKGKRQVGAVGLGGDQKSSAQISYYGTL